MLVASWGFDSAISQVIYYHTTKDINFMTVSKKYINSFLKRCSPQILLGYNNISLDVIPNIQVLIDNTKTSEETYSEVKNTICRYHTSKASLLYEYIKAEPIWMRLVNLVDFANQITDKVSFYDLYLVLGHESFVNRFIMNPEPFLTKNEELLITKFQAFKELEASMILSEFSTKHDYMFISKCPMMLQRLIEMKVFEKYEDVSILLFWAMENDGTIKVTLKSKNDLAGKIAGYFKGSEYYYNGFFNISIPESDMDVNQYLKSVVSDAVGVIEKNSLASYFDVVQNDLDSNDKIISMFDLNF